MPARRSIANTNGTQATKRADDELIERAQAGDEIAVEQLFHLIDPHLRRYLGSTERHDVDDLVGEVWLAVARAFSSFRGDMDDLRAWIFTIAQRRLIDHRRRRSFRQTEVTNLRDDPTLDEHRVDEQVLAELSGHAAARRVRELLPHDQADVVLLRVLGQFEVHEVAAIMGRSENWVRVAHHRGLRRLADRLRTAEGVRL